MKHPALPTCTRLHRHEFMHFKRPQALRLQADCGTLWVTVDGEPEDIEINAGDSRVFDGHAAVTVGTLGGDALFTATPLTPPGWLSRLRAQLNGWRLAPARALEA